MNRYYDFLKSIGAQNIHRTVLFLEEGCTARIDYFGLKGSKKNLRLPWMFSDQYVRSDRSPSSVTETPTVLKLYVLRHGETTAGEDTFSGTHDFGLTMMGIE